jgi:hypothetical protein
MASTSPLHTSPTWSQRNSESEDTVIDDEIMSEKSLSNSMADLEAQQPILSTEKSSPSPLAMEYRVPARKKLLYLGGYFLLNLSLTLYNKALLGNVSFVDTLSYEILTLEY